ncbi:unnamed protein product [Rhodiola kirilowii]
MARRNATEKQIGHPPTERPIQTDLLRSQENAMDVLVAAITKTNESYQTALKMSIAREAKQSTYY